MKYLLRKYEVKFAIMCAAHFIRAAYFILRSRISLAAGFFLAGLAEMNL